MLKVSFWFDGMFFCLVVVVVFFFSCLEILSHMSEATQDRRLAVFEESWKFDSYMARYILTIG